MIVTCNGCFDVIHAGHLFFLGYAVAIAEGGELVVGINSDDYIRIKKGVEPVPSDQRAADLLSLDIVDRVVVFDEDDPREFIRNSKTDIHCIGEEYRDTAIELSVCEEIGCGIAYVPRIGDWSSVLSRHGHG